MLHLLATQSEADVDPVVVVVKPLPQLAQNEPSRKYPTSQMHSEAEVAPGAAVVLGIYLLSTLGSQLRHFVPGKAPDSEALLHCIET